MWIDPNNGKYLGKYDEFEVKGEGILYGKADGGRVMTPLYKIAVMNFHAVIQRPQYGFSARVVAMNTDRRVC